MYGGNDKTTAWTNYSQITATPTDFPLPPIRVTLLSFTATSVSITWDLPPSSPPATTYKVMLSQCYTDRLVEQCAEFQDYVDPDTGALQEFPTKFATVGGLATEYNYELLVGARNLNFHGYASLSDPLTVRPDNSLWGSAAILQVTGVERDKIYLSWQPASGEHLQSSTYTTALCLRSVTNQDQCRQRAR